MYLSLCIESKDPRPSRERGSHEAAKTLIRSGCPLHIRSFGTAYDQFSTEKLFIVQFLNSSSSFLDGCHLYEGEAFGTLCVLMADDFGTLHLADPVKQFDKVAFRGIKGQVAHVKLRRGNLHQFGLPANLLSRRRRRAWSRFFSNFRRLFGRTLKKRDDSLPD